MTDVGVFHLFRPYKSGEGVYHKELVKNLKLEMLRLGIFGDKLDIDENAITTVGATEIAELMQVYCIKSLNLSTQNWLSE